MNIEVSKRRLFIALWPNAAQRKQLRQTLKILPLPKQARAVKADNWHITLKFIGACDEQQQACIEQRLAALTIPAIQGLSLDCIGHWSRPRVVWLGCHRPPSELAPFVNKLDAVLEQGCDCKAEERGYIPHLTILRKVRSYRAADLAQPVRLDFSGIALVESQTTPDGVHYEVLRFYPAG